MIDDEHFPAAAAAGPATLVLEADLSFFLRKNRLLRSFFRRRFRWSSSSTEFGLKKLLW